ncbi:transposase [Dethiothermospora halolimnae]|uniref:transposase n=1 Tax=Dethiothermospora halolimnae TaxID=3114390 RepID=UPI003CCB7958
MKKTIKGNNTTEYNSLIFIPGIGPIISSGTLAEIGTITSFSSYNGVARYADNT